MIFVTGATGFVGIHLIHELSRKYDGDGRPHTPFAQDFPELEGVRCLVRKSSNISNLERYNVEIFYGDLRDRESLIIGLRDVKTVIHLASITKATKLSDYYKVNVEGTRNLIEIGMENNIEKFVYLSSLNSHLPVKNAYSRSKYEAECLVKEMLTCKTVILRPANIFGEGDKGFLSSLTGIVSKSPIVPVIGSGNRKVQPIYVKDVANAIIEAVLDNAYDNKVWYLVGDDILTYNQIIDIICNCIEKRRVKIHIPYNLIKFLLEIASSANGSFVWLSDKLVTYNMDSIIGQETVEGNLHSDLTSFEDFLSKKLPHHHR